MKKAMILSLMCLTSTLNAMWTPHPPTEVEAVVTSFEHPIPLENATQEWECPISEVVVAPTREEAFHQVTEACRHQVWLKSSEIPGTFGTLDVFLEWPEVHVQEVTEGFFFHGKFVFESFVLQELKIKK